MPICVICNIPKIEDEFYVYNGYREKRCIPCRKELNSIWQKQNLHKKRQHQRKKLYGITENEYQAKLAQQKNKCAICEIEFNEKIRPHIDHDHNTGKVRDLLCKLCNNALGFLGEDVDRLVNVINYINKHKRI